MSNIAEGYERDNNKEFIKFLGYSKGSVGEVRNLLYVALDQEYVSENEFHTLREMATNISTQNCQFYKISAQKSKFCKIIILQFCNFVLL